MPTFIYVSQLPLMVVFQSPKVGHQGHGVFNVEFLLKPFFPKHVYNEIARDINQCIGGLLHFLAVTRLS